MKKSKSTIIYSLVISIAVIVLANLLANRFFFRLDLTEDNRYTLSEATKDLLQDLPEPVTVKAYFSEDLPPDIQNVRREFKDLLIEYSQISKGMLVYEFINPAEDETIANEAMQEGIAPIQINVREKDQMKVQKAYLGAVIQMGEQNETLPVIQSVEGMEYSLSSAIKKLSVIDKPVVGILQGHGEPSMPEFRQVRQDLEVLYEVMPIRLTDSTRELNKVNTLAIVAPADSFPQNHLMQLDEFLAQGKSMFVAVNRVDANLQQGMGTGVTTGLERWLSSKGIEVNANFVIDANCGSVQAVQQVGPMQIPTQIQFPYLPIIQNFADHPISGGLEAVIMQFASSLSFTGDSTIMFNPIAMTSENSGTEGLPKYFDIQKEWGENDFPLSNLTVAATFEGQFVGDMFSRMVVAGDGNFPLNGTGQQGGQINPDNASLMVNSIDWLSDDTGLIELRTKGATMRPIEDIEDAKRTFLKYFNFALPIILAVIIGIIRFQRKQLLRVKRMEVDYV